MKTLFGLFGVFICTFAFAETETPMNVSNRLTCPEIQEKISELSEIQEPDTETIEQITNLKSDYRRNCSRSAGNRRSNANLVQPDTEITPSAPSAESDNGNSETDTIVPSQTQTPDSSPILSDPENQDAPKELTPEQELANLDAGLCADGSTPNRFGCCGDEIFKDLGNTVFACCPPDGGDCFPPLN